MKLYKVDTKAWTVREVTGSPWPGTDNEGDTCYDNTHFVSEAGAWEKLKREVTAEVCLAGSDVRNARDELRAAEAHAATMAEAIYTVVEQMRQRATPPQPGDSGRGDGGGRPNAEVRGD